MDESTQPKALSEHEKEELARSLWFRAVLRKLTLDEREPPERPYEQAAMLVHRAHAIEGLDDDTKERLALEERRLRDHTDRLRGVVWSHTVVGGLGEAELVVGADGKQRISRGPARTMDADWFDLSPRTGRGQPRKLWLVQTCAEAIAAGLTPIVMARAYVQLTDEGAFEQAKVDMGCTVDHKCTREEQIEAARQWLTNPWRAASEVLAKR